MQLARCEEHQNHWEKFAVMEILHEFWNYFVIDLPSFEALKLLLETGKLLLQ